METDSKVNDVMQKLCCLYLYYKYIYKDMIITTEKLYYYTIKECLAVNKGVGYQMWVFNRPKRKRHISRSKKSRTDLETSCSKV